MNYDCHFNFKGFACRRFGKLISVVFVVYGHVLCKLTAFEKFKRRVV